MRKQLLSILSFFAVCIVVITLLTTTASADESGTFGDNLTWSFNSSTGTLTISGTGEIPDYDGMMGPPWQNNVSPYVKELIIGNNVTKIGKYAFNHLLYATSVVIGNKVSNIGFGAFYNCKKITNITIPQSVISIDSQAFRGCTALTSITIPQNVKSIGGSAFYECSGLKRVNISDGVVSIGNSAFSGCTSLEDVVIGNSVTSIGYDAFANCTEIIKVKYTGTIEDWCNISFQTLVATMSKSSNPIFYGKELYINNELITDLVIPNSVKRIGNRTFTKYSALKSVTIPDSVTSIGDEAFFGCTGLTSITIPDSVTSIGEMAFAQCSGLTSLTLSENVTSLGGGVLSGCTGLTSIVIPESLNGTGRNTFAGCTGLTSVIFPANIKKIDYKAFYNCSGLTSITIPESVTSIGEGAFAKCSGLTSITIPEIVTSIDRYAFDQCSNLEEIKFNAINVADFENSVFSSSGTAGNGINVLFGDLVERIPAKIFNTKISLKSISFGNSVTNIGEDAFSGCDDCIVVDYKGTIEDWCNIDFSNYDSNPHAKELYFNEFLIKDLKIPDTVCNIKNYAFCGCIGLTSITIPDSITRIGKSAFSNCTDLNNIRYNAVNAAIGQTYEAFSKAGINGDGITVNFGASVSVIPQYLFYSSDYYSRPKITQVYMGKSISRIDSYAFNECRFLKNIYFDGTSEDRKQINIFKYNDSFVNANWIYYSHAYIVEIIKKPTCKDYGKEKYTCELCGYSYTKQIAKTDNHDWEIITVIPTCTKEGGDNYVCRICGLNELKNNKPELGHSFTNYVYNNDATTEKDGTETAKCERCEATDTRSAVGTMIIPDMFTLTYNANGGTGAPSRQNGNGIITLSSVKPSRDGYCFLGWANLSGSTSAQYQPGATFSLTDNTTLYAVWQNNNETPSVYTLSYNANGGSGAPADQKGIGNIELSYSAPTRNSYTFLGWATTASAASAQYQPGAIFCLTDNTTLYAVWQNNNETPSVYTLSYNANGGSGAPADQKGIGNIELSYSAPTRNSYTFLGWATTASAASAQYQPGAEINLTDNTTLYAVWQKVEEVSEYKLPKDYGIQYAAYNTIVTVTVTLNNVPSNATVYIDGKPADANGNRYSADIGQVGSTRNVRLEVKQGGKVLDSETLTIGVNSTFMGKLSSFFSNFLFNMFSWRKVTVNF